MNKFWLSIIMYMYYLNFKCMYTYQPKSVNFSIYSTGIGFYFNFYFIAFVCSFAGFIMIESLIEYE